MVAACIDLILQMRKPRLGERGHQWFSTIATIYSHLGAFKTSISKPHPSLIKQQSLGMGSGPPYFLKLPTWFQACSQVWESGVTQVVRVELAFKPRQAEPESTAVRRNSQVIHLDFEIVRQATP